jgi:hypothetical protein
MPLHNAPLKAKGRLAPSLQAAYKFFYGIFSSITADTAFSK